MNENKTSKTVEAIKFLQNDVFINRQILTQRKNVSITEKQHIIQENGELFIEFILDKFDSLTIQLPRSKTIPLKIKIKGSFKELTIYDESTPPADVSKNFLKKLPDEINGSLSIYSNNIKNLEGCPGLIDGNFIIQVPKLNSLKGISNTVITDKFILEQGEFENGFDEFPNFIGNGACFADCKIKNFRGMENINSVNCVELRECRNLESFEGFPKIGDRLTMYNTPLENVRTIASLEGKVDLIEYQNALFETYENFEEFFYGVLEIKNAFFPNENVFQCQQKVI